jgi:hypothetical protein
MANMFETELGTDPVEDPSKQQKKPAEGQKTLQEQVQDVGRQALAESKSTSTNPESSAAILEQMRQLSENPEFQRGAPPETRKSLDEAMAEAKRIYDEKATRNEWLEVAQLLGRAVFQFGASATGGTTDMSNIAGSVPVIDYEKRTSRAFGEYQDGIKQAYNKADDARTQWKDHSDERGEEYGKRWDYLGKALQTANQKEDDERRARAGSDQDKKLELAELNRQESELMKQLKSRQSLINMFKQEPDLSPKSQKKLEEKYSGIAANAGIDIGELRAEVEGTDTEGRLWGKNPDPAKRAEIYKSKTDELNTLLGQIRNRKKQLGVVNLPEQPQKSAPPARDPAIQKFATDNGLTYEQADAIIQKRKQQQQK